VTALKAATFYFMVVHLVQDAATKSNKSSVINFVIIEGNIFNLLAQFFGNVIFNTLKL